MNTSTNPIFANWWQMLAFASAVTSVLTTVGVYLVARFTTVFDAYVGEHAKLMAQFQSIDRLVVQTEQLTRAAEGIKAQVTDQVWDRQMRWTYKRDVYIRLIESLGRMRTGLSRLQAAFNSDISGEAWAQEVAASGAKQVTEALDEFLCADDVAPVVASKGVLAALDGLRQLKYGTFESGDEIAATFASLNKQLGLLRQAAAEDLGYKTI